MVGQVSHLQFPQMGPLVDPRWLADNIQDPRLRVIDFRWYLDGRSGLAAYRKGHIPGAVFVDLDGEVSGHRPGAGRHPLPEGEAFQRVMREAGVSRNSQVVVYDDQGGSPAARLWWLLRYFGHDAVGVLDGGLGAWVGELSTEVETVPEGDFCAADPRLDMKLDYDAVRQLAGPNVLIDARQPQRFRGEVEPIDPVAGHIPGARNAPWEDNLGPDGRLKAPQELRQRFAALGINEGPQAVAYCGSGVSACMNLLALEVAGLPGARLYPGSWSDWSKRPDAPVATGR
jgi:thiosulfate/3-mercaptopyruvate sulfurtransferase